MANDENDFVQNQIDAARGYRYRKTGNHRYQCLICNKAFTTVTGYHQHKRASHDGPAESYQPLGNICMYDRDGANRILCLFCEKGFATLENFNYHAAKEHVDSFQEQTGLKHQCLYCHISSTDVYKILKHAKIHLDAGDVTAAMETRRHFICQICNIRFNKNKSLITHKSLHHRESSDIFEPLGKICKYQGGNINNRLKCLLCSKVLENAQFFNEHVTAEHIQQFHQEEQPIFKCLSCYRTDPDFDKILKHLECHVRIDSNATALQARTARVIPPKKDGNKCLICNKICESKKGLKIHRNYVHDNVRFGNKYLVGILCMYGGDDKNRVHCLLCNQTLQKPSNFLKHLRKFHVVKYLINGKYLYTCGFCEGNSESEEVVTKHLESHVENKDRFVAATENALQLNPDEPSTSHAAMTSLSQQTSRETFTTTDSFSTTLTARGNVSVVEPTTVTGITHKSVLPLSPPIIETPIINVIDSDPNEPSTSHRLTALLSSQPTSEAASSTTLPFSTNVSTAQNVAYSDNALSPHAFEKYISAEQASGEASFSSLFLPLNESPVLNLTELDPDEALTSHSRMVPLPSQQTSREAFNFSPTFSACINDSPLLNISELDSVESLICHALRNTQQTNEVCQPVSETQPLEQRETINLEFKPDEPTTSNALGTGQQEINAAIESVHSASTSLPSTDEDSQSSSSDKDSQLRFNLEDPPPTDEGSQSEISNKSNASARSGSESQTHEQIPTSNLEFKPDELTTSHAHRTTPQQLTTASESVHNASASSPLVDEFQFFEISQSTDENPQSEITDISDTSTVSASEVTAYNQRGTSRSFTGHDSPPEVKKLKEWDGN